MSIPHIPSRAASLARIRSDAERRYGHTDHVDRGRLLTRIDAAGDLRLWSQVELHSALGLHDGSLRDGSLTTADLRAALAKLSGDRT